MNLSDLFTRGSKLSDVPSGFKGMPYREWRLKTTLEMISQQGKAHRDALAKQGTEPPKWSTVAPATPRDSYGWKSA
jgi:hypothetical protein